MTFRAVDAPSDDVASGNFRALPYVWNCLPPNVRLSGARTSKLSGGVPIIGETAYREFFHKSLSLRAILDTAGKIEDLSDSLRELAGLRVSEGVGMPIWELSLWNNEGRAWLGQAVAAACSGEQLRHELDVTLGRSAGPFDLSLTPIRDDAGDVSVLLLEVSNMAPGNRERLTFEGLRESEALGEVARLAAHDFNNLLAGIAGNLELVARRQDFDEIAGRRMERALRAVFRGRALTDLMDVFTRANHEPRAVDIAAIVNSVVELCRSGLDIQLDVAMEFEKGLWRCRANPDRLAAALLNLMINAYDVLPRGARILVRATNRTLERERRKSTTNLTAGDYLLFCISHESSEEQDGGGEAPISADVRAHRGHVGLGLKMVAAFAMQSGGELVLADKLEHGTVSCLYLPRAFEPVDI